LPVTGAVPTVVPVEVQLVGAEDCGPKTLKVIVPEGLDPLARAPETELVAIAVPAVPLAGPVAEIVGLAAATTVLDMPDPQVLAAELLFESPP
jgi:hypothetical protein